MDNLDIKDKLIEYIYSGNTGIYLETSEYARVDIIVESLASELGSEILEWDFGYGFIDFTNKQPLQELDSVSNIQLSQSLPSLYDIDEELGYKIILIKNINDIISHDSLSETRLHHLISRLKSLETYQSCVIMVGDSGQIPHLLSDEVLLIDIPTPSRDYIKEIITTFANRKKISINEAILSKLIVISSGLTSSQIKQSLNLAFHKFKGIDNQALFLIMDAKKQIIAKTGTLEMVEVNTDINDIGGLENLKEWLESKAHIIENLEESEKNGVTTPKGVLIAGMPGCGKSLTAKATATLFHLPLLRMDMGSLLGKYVGDSESNMKKALKIADSISPCVLWIDELEKAFAGASGANSSEVTTRLLGFFLTWMQEKTGAVFVIATANDVTKVPPELLRKGRFDEIFYVGFPNKDERKIIFNIHLKKSHKDITHIQVDKLVENSKFFAGSDIESVIHSAIEKSYVKKMTFNTNLILEVLKETVPLRETLKDSIKQYEDIFEKQKLSPASKSFGVSITEIKNLKDGNKLERLKIAQDANIPEDILEDLVKDKNIDVALKAIANENMTAKMLSKVIEDNQAETNNDGIKKFNMAIKHENCPFDLLSNLLVSSNEILSDKNKQTLSKLVGNHYLQIGEMYFEGRGVPQNYIQAMACFKKSANANNSEAMYQLGEMYCNSLSVKRNYIEAMKWYKQSGNLNNACAMVGIGNLYYYGLGVHSDIKQALEWYNKGLALNHDITIDNFNDSNALLIFGNMYYNGEGVTTDYIEAIKWFKKSANLNNADAMEQIGDMYCNGQGVVKSYTQSMAWYQKASNFQNISAKKKFEAVQNKPKNIGQFELRADRINFSDTLLRKNRWFK